MRNAYKGQTLVWLALLGIACGMTQAAAPSAMPSPVALPPSTSTRTLLTIKTADGDKRYSLPALEQLGLFRLTTESFWPSDQGSFEGVRLSDLLKDAGIADSAAIRVTAVDDFSQMIPRKDWETWPILVATRHAGVPLQIGNKGPLRIIYPRDLDASLSNEIYRLRWVWMIQSIEPVAP